MRSGPFPDEIVDWDGCTSLIPDLLPAEAEETEGRATRQYRQGDVLLVPVAPLEKAHRSVRREAGRVVLAHGEVTGHAHAIASPNARLLEGDGERFLVVSGEAVLGHEEHAAIELAPGTYRVVIQREYVPADVTPAGFRRVVD